MNFSILTPLPHTQVPIVGRVGGGGQNLFAYCGRCVWIWTLVLNIFFCLWTPELMAGVPGPNSRYPWSAPLCMGPASEDFHVFTLHRLFSGT